MSRYRWICPHRRCLSIGVRATNSGAGASDRSIRVLTTGRVRLVRWDAERLQRADVCVVAPVKPLSQWRIGLHEWHSCACVDPLMPCILLLRFVSLLQGELFAVKEVSLGPDAARNGEAVQQLQQEVRSHGCRTHRAFPAFSLRRSGTIRVRYEGTVRPAPVALHPVSRTGSDRPLGVSWSEARAAKHPQRRRILCPSRSAQRWHLTSSPERIRALQLPSASPFPNDLRDPSFSKPLLSRGRALLTTAV